MSARGCRGADQEAKEVEEDEEEAAASASASRHCGATLYQIDSDIGRKARTERVMRCSLIYRMPVLPFFLRPMSMWL